MRFELTIGFPKRISAPNLVSNPSPYQARRPGHLSPTHLLVDELSLVHPRIEQRFRNSIKSQRLGQRVLIHR